MTIFDEHDYKNYPELSNVELQEIGLTSPHEQITHGFLGFVVKCHDGDTVTLRCDFRDFDFPMRFSAVDAPELSTGIPGAVARDYLKMRVEGCWVWVEPSKQRVEKYGRLLGDLVDVGGTLGDEMVALGYSLPFTRRREGELPDLNKVYAEKQWF